MGVESLLLLNLQYIRSGLLLGWPCVIFRQPVFHLHLHSQHSKTLGLSLTVILILSLTILFVGTVVLNVIITELYIVR